MPFDVSVLEATGNPVPLLENLRYSSSQGDGWFSISHSGTLLYQPGEAENTRLAVVSVDEGGRTKQV